VNSNYFSENYTNKCVIVHCDSNKLCENFGATEQHQFNKPAMKFCVVRFNELGLRYIITMAKNERHTTQMMPSTYQWHTVHTPFFCRPIPNQKYRNGKRVSAVCVKEPADSTFVAKSCILLNYLHKSKRTQAPYLTFFSYTNRRVM